MSFSSLRVAIAMVGVLAAGASAQAPSNNECGAATVVTDGINPSAPFGVSGTLFTNVAATNSLNFGGSCVGATQFNKDVFFSYVATCTGTTTFSTCTPAGFTAGTLGDTVLDIYAASACPAGGTALACNDQFCGNRSETSLATTAGATYYVRVGSFSTTATGTFYLSVRPAGPPNDECSAATPLFVGPNAGSTACATPSLGTSCTGFTTPVADVWHTFTPASDCILEVTMTGAGANRVGLYTGVCGTAQTVLECDSASLFDVQTTATAGTTYFVRVGRSAAPGADTSYTLVVDCTPLASNDECTGAIPVTDGINPAAPLGVAGQTFTNFGATESVGFAATAACAGAGHPGTSDVFFSYTSTIDGPVKVSLCTPPGFPTGTLQDTVLELFDAASCPGGGPALACNDQACNSLSELTFTATFGVTYYLRVSSWDTTNTVEGSFYLTIDPTLNDECVTAQVVAAGVAVVVHGTLRTATPSAGVAIGVCVLPTDIVTADAWFSVTTTYACDVTVQLSGNGANFFQVFDGSCASLSPLNCTGSVGGAGIAPDMFAPAGTTLLIHVGRKAPGLQAGPFTLQIKLPLPPANDECTSAIQIFDGINPAPFFGDPAQAFTTVHATSSPPTSGFEMFFGQCPPSTQPNGVNFNDVFFSYFAPCTSNVRIDLCSPPGFPATVNVGKIEIFPMSACPLGSGNIACGVVNCVGVTGVVFSAVAGQSYLIRVGRGAFDTLTEFNFYLTVDPAFCLIMDAPAGPGSIRVRNLSGPPNSVAITVLTVFAGSFPNGLFFGIDPTYTEIILQGQTNSPPFVNFLDAEGNATFGPLLGAPPITIYGVSLALSPIGQLAAISPPTSFSIP